MFDRVTLTASDLDASRRFYATLLGAVGRENWADFALVAGSNPTTGLHVAFGVASRAEVDRAWRAAVDAGYPDDGEPGPRPLYGPTYYGGFLRDPDGNSAEAVHREALRADGAVDHLWLGVSDLEASAAFYGGLPGIEQVHEVPGERVHFGGGAHGGTFAVVADGRPPTANLGLAFTSSDVGAWTDPDGNRVEVVRPAEFGVPGPLRDRLVAAILRGEKTATSSLLAEWEAEGTGLPRAGERQTIVDSDGRRVGGLELTAVETIRLGDADDALAHDEGEGFADAADWRAAHLEFWQTDSPDVPLIDDTPIVVERFRAVP